MADPGLVTWEVTPWFLTAAMMATLAGLRVRLHRRDAANRALAVLMAAGAIYNIGTGFLVNGGTLHGPGWLLPIASFALPLAALYFAVVIRMDPEKRKGAGAMFFALFMLLTSLFLIWPEGWAHAEGDQLVPGPLFITIGLVYPAYALVAFLFVQSYQRTADPVRRRSFATAAIGFACLPGYVALSDFVLVDVTGAQPEVGFYWGAHMLALSSLLPLGGMFFLLGRTAFQSKDDTVKADLAKLLKVLSLPVLSVLAVAFVVKVRGPSAGFAADGLFEGIWSLISPPCIAYAVLRSTIPDLDERLQTALERVLLLVVFSMVFVVVEELVRRHMSWWIALLAGTVAAAALLPFRQGMRTQLGQMFTARHGAKGPTPRQQYLAAAIQAWSDGKLTVAEHHALEQLRLELQLSHDEAWLLETEALPNSSPRVPKQP